MSKQFRLPGRRERLAAELDWWWEKLIQCRLHGRHVEKMSSHGRCYRCGKPLRVSGRER